MDLNFISFLVISLCIISVRSEFPDDPKPCKYGDTECIKEVINFLFKEKTNDHVITTQNRVQRASVNPELGEPSLNLQNMQPLELKEGFHLQQDKGSPVNIDLRLKNGHIDGFESARAVKVKGFDKDMTKKHSILLHADSLSTVGNYTIDGKILILPIKGDGKSNITMVDATLKMDFVGVPYEKDGATYMRIDKLDLYAEPKRMIFKVENLFNGDKALGDNMNMFLNENWKEIYEEVRLSLALAYSKVFMQVINEVFSKYPYEKFFKE